MTNRDERTDRFILDEYAAKRAAPVFLPNGRPVSLELVQQLRRKVQPQPEREDVA